MAAQDPRKTAPNGADASAHLDESEVPLDEGLDASEQGQAPAIEPGQWAALQAKVGELEQALVEAQAQTRHYAQSFDRAKQEFAAAQERIQREHERSVRRDQVKTVAGLLSVLDTLDRSLDSAARTGPSAAFVEGVQRIRHQFEAALAEMGLSRFDAAGELFDPARHQAVTTTPVPDPALDGRVVQVLAAGARIGDEVVRPATVVVGRHVPAEPAQS